MLLDVLMLAQSEECWRDILLHERLCEDVTQQQTIDWYVSGPVKIHGLTNLLYTEG